MERQEFLKKAGVGSILASFPIFAGGAWADHRDDDEDDDGLGRLRFYFVAFSGVPEGSPPAAGPLTETSDAIVMSGCGKFNRWGVSGGGEYVRTDGTEIPNAPVIDTGSWRARRLLDFQPDPQGRTWGVVTPGVVRMKVTLISASGARIRGARLEVVCNVGPAGIITGFGPEGFTLSGGGLPTFVQLNPTVGLTLITRPVGRRDD
jgi:hypothetical protein